MFKRNAVALAVGGAALFSGCASPVQPQLKVEPIMAVRNAGAEAERMYRIGRQYLGQQRLGDAEQAFLKALACDTNHAEAHNALGVVYFEQGLSQKAEQQFKLAVAAAPTRVHLINNLGFFYQEINRYEDAINAYSEALVVDPDNRHALDGLAVLTCRDSSVCTASAQLAVELPEQSGSAVRTEVSPAGVVPPTAPTVSLTRLAPNVWELQPLPVPTVATTGTAEVAPTVVLPASRIEVSNGNGVAGLAKRVGVYLHGHGFPAPRLTNHRTFKQRYTEVQYVPGAEALARRVSGSLDSHARLVPVARLERRMPVRLVLGTDFNESQSIANEGRPSGNQVALVSRPEQK